MSYSEIHEAIKQLSHSVYDFKMPAVIQLGTVKSVSPLQVQVDQKLIFDEKVVKLTSVVKDYEVDVTVPVEMDVTVNVTVDGKSGTGTGHGKGTYTGKGIAHNSFKVGDTLVLLRLQGGQNYYTIGRY